MGFMPKCLLHKLRDFLSTKPRTRFLNIGLFVHYSFALSANSMDSSSSQFSCVIIDNGVIRTEEGPFRAALAALAVSDGE